MKRRWFRFHLSTGILTVFFASFWLYVNVAPEFSRNKSNFSSEMNYGWPFVLLRTTNMPSRLELQDKGDLIEIIMGNGNTTWAVTETVEVREGTMLTYWQMQCLVLLSSSESYSAPPSYLNMLPTAASESRLPVETTG